MSTSARACHLSHGIDYSVERHVICICLMPIDFIQKSPAISSLFSKFKVQFINDLNYYNLLVKVSFPKANLVHPFHSTAITRFITRIGLLSGFFYRHLFEIAFFYNPCREPQFSTIDTRICILCSSNERAIFLSLFRQLGIYRSSFKTVGWCII